MTAARQRAAWDPTVAQREAELLIRLVTARAIMLPRLDELGCVGLYRRHLEILDDLIEELRVEK